MPNESINNSVEILCIGSELLLGNILNGNAKWLAEELASLGLPHFKQTVVGDNSTRIKEEVIGAAKRCRVLITTGGLGPTQDDITTKTLAETFNSPLEESKEILLDIEAKMQSIGKPMSINNRKQALFPKGAMVLPNPSGTAPGIIWSPNSSFTVITFPGVPSELKIMWQKTASLWLKKNIGQGEIILSKVLKFSGIRESELAETVPDLMEASNPTLAPYAELGEVKLRITAKARTIEKAEQLLNPVNKELRHRTGLKCFGSDDETLASVVLELLRKKGQTLGVAESCTGGGVGAALTSMKGASDTFVGGVIAYSNSIKQKMLDVPSDLLTQHGAVSEPVVKAMAKGVKKRLGTDWGIAVSGLAGPGGGTHLKPVGLVYFAVAGPESLESKAEQFGAHYGRLGIQKLSVVSSLDQLRLTLLSQGYGHDSIAFKT